MSHVHDNVTQSLLVVKLFEQHRTRVSVGATTVYTFVSLCLVAHETCTCACTCQRQQRKSARALVRFDSSSENRRRLNICVSFSLVFRLSQAEAETEAETVCEPPKPNRSDSFCSYFPLVNCSFSFLNFAYSVGLSMAIPPPVLPTFL